MKAWFEGLNERERLLVAGAGLLLLLLLVYALVWAPVHSARRALQDKVAGQRATVAWMQQGAQRLAQFRSSQGPARQGLGGQSLLALADSSARADGLGDVLKRVEPDGSNSVKVWMEAASFDKLVGWLGNLNTRYGIHIDTVSMDRAADMAGRVNVRVTLQTPES
jgi:general secretion pathway protein M